MAGLWSDGKSGLFRRYAGVDVTARGMVIGDHSPPRGQRPGRPTCHACPDVGYEERNHDVQSGGGQQGARRREDLITHWRAESS